MTHEVFHGQKVLTEPGTDGFFMANSWLVDGSTDDSLVAL